MDLVLIKSADIGIANIQAVLILEHAFTADIHELIPANIFGCYISLLY